MPGSDRGARYSSSSDGNGVPAVRERRQHNHSRSQGIRVRIPGFYQKRPHGYQYSGLINVY